MPKLYEYLGIIILFRTTMNNYTGDHNIYAIPKDKYCENCSMKIHKYNYKDKDEKNNNYVSTLSDIIDNLYMYIKNIIYLAKNWTF